MNEIETKKNNGPDVELFFIRHSKKGEDNLLTQEGKEYAKKKGEEIRNEIGNVFKITGSPIERAQQTARCITKEEGEKIRKNELIGFYICEDLRGKKYEELETEEERTKWKFYEKCDEAAKRGNYNEFIVKESDKRFREIKDPKISSYTKCAGDFAEIILEKLNAIKKLKKIKGENYDQKFYRIYVSHQGIIELFLIKVIEKLYGVESRDKFMEENGLIKGVNYCEGYKVEIISNGKITIKYKDKEIEISEDLLNDIIKDKEELLSKIKNK